MHRGANGSVKIASNQIRFREPFQLVVARLVELVCKPPGRCLFAQGEGDRTSAGVNRQVGFRAPGRPEIPAGYGHVPGGQYAADAELSLVDLVPKPVLGFGRGGLDGLNHIRVSRDSRPGHVRQLLGLCAGGQEQEQHDQL